MVNDGDSKVKRQVSLLEFEEMLVSNGYNPFEHFFNTVVLTASGGIWSQVDSKTDEGVWGELAQEDTTVLAITMLAYADRGTPVTVDKLFARERPNPVDLAGEFFAPQHPVHELSQKGIESRPDLEKRMLAAAELVEADKVKLVEVNLATVDSRSSDKFYMVNNGRCSCKDAQFRNAKECAHALAVRMARSLGQEIEGKDREEERMAHQREVAEIGRRQEQDWSNYMLKSAEGARRYARKAYANGATTVKPSVGSRLAEAYNGGGNV